MSEFETIIINGKVFIDAQALNAKDKQIAELVEAVREIQNNIINNPKGSYRGPHAGSINARSYHIATEALEKHSKGASDER